MNILEVKNLSIEFDKTIVISNFSFNFQKGIYSIIGRNGTGKTSLLKEIYSSKIIPNQNILTTGEMELVMNDFTLSNDSISVFDFLRAKLGEENMDEWFNKIKPFSTKAGWNEKSFSKSFSQLSGGERKLANMFSLIVSKPQIILFDEPEAHFDKNKKELILELIKEFAKNSLVIIATHSEYFLEIANKEIFEVRNADVHIITKAEAIKIVNGDSTNKQEVVFHEDFEFPN